MKSFLIDIDGTYKCYSKTEVEEYIELLNATKSQIDTNPRKWNHAKKFINDYEYIYSSSNIYKNVSSIRVISRSYFKILEIYKHFGLNVSGDVHCIAEAPGGFVQFLTKNIPNIHIYGITLETSKKDNSKIPHWNKFILNDPNVTILKGADNTGDIYKLDNIFHYISHVGLNQSELVTGDGGFDYTKNFSDQENSSYKLIYSEIFMSFLLLKKNGIFICKIFDIFTENTIRLLYLVYLNFEKVHIYKPCLSRSTNSERYIVCEGYKGYNKKFINLMIHCFHKKLDIEVSDLFRSTINYYSVQYTIEQITDINRGVCMLSQNIPSTPRKEQITIATEWCKKYNVSTHNLVT